MRSLYWRLLADAITKKQLLGINGSNNMKMLFEYENFQNWICTTLNSGKCQPGGAWISQTKLFLAFREDSKVSADGRIMAESSKKPGGKKRSYDILLKGVVHLDLKYSEYSIEIWSAYCILMWQTNCR